MRSESVLFNGVVLRRVYPGTVREKQVQRVASLPLANELSAVAKSVCFPPWSLQYWEPSKNDISGGCDNCTVWSRDYGGANDSCLLSYQPMMREPHLLWLRVSTVQTRELSWLVVSKHETVQVGLPGLIAG